MKNNFYIFIRNFLVCWFILSIIPGIESVRGPVAFAIVCSVFAGLRVFLPSILKFFKFGFTIWSKLIIGILITFAFFALFQSLIFGIVRFESSYIGGTDFLIFTAPVFFRIANEWMVILLSAIFVNFCSIILAFLGNTKT